MKWLLRTLAALVAVIVLIVVIGGLLPKAHEVTRSARYTQPPDVVWRAITDFPAMPSWRGDVERIERGPDRNGHPVWVEISGGDRLPLEVEETQAPRRMVTRIADPDRRDNHSRLSADGADRFSFRTSFICAICAICGQSLAS